MSKTPVTVLLSGETIAWLEKNAREEMRTRATFAAKLLEQISRGIYVPVVERETKK